MNVEKGDRKLFHSVKQIIIEARKEVYKKTNTALLNMYWEIGRLIVDDEQSGQQRASYGKYVLKNLGVQLSLEFGKGFDERNLNNMRAFYHAFPIWNAVRTELSWTHYRILSRVDDKNIREQYMLHAIEGNWNTRTLQRNIDSQYVGRLMKVPEQSITKKETRHFIKDPYIFEFVGLPQPHNHTEKELETALINHIREFLMELGKGFAFVARQQHIVTDTADFFIDLVFYNYYLKCFVLIDLKTNKLTHEAIGQMDMYVRMYNDLKTTSGDNPTIGIILCTDKDETIIKYSVLAENKKMFASRYMLYMPKEEELKQLIDHERTLFELHKKEQDESK